MIEEILANVEKELSIPLSTMEKEQAEELIVRGFDSKSIAQTFKNFWR